jgi:hypothetical protein
MKNSNAHELFHQLLIKIDSDFSKESMQEGCPCGGKLHQANYPRSPFGLSEKSRDYYQTRFSSCCGDCRRRKTPKSVRFFGRRWYVAPIFILMNALKLHWSDRNCASIQRHFGIKMTKRTWRRWRRWWLECFELTDFWKQAKGLISINYCIGPFPRTLFHIYPLPWSSRFVSVLKFFAPLTAGAFRAV